MGQKNYQVVPDFFHPQQVGCTVQSFAMLMWNKGWLQFDNLNDCPQGGWTTHVRNWHGLRRKKRKCGTGVSLYKMEFCTFQGFQVRPRFSHSIPLQNGLCICEGFLYSKQPFCLHVCSCQVPHFVEASGCENHKNAKKRGLGALILQRRCLATFVAGS